MKLWPVQQNIYHYAFGTMHPKQPSNPNSLFLYAGIRAGKTSLFFEMVKDYTAYNPNKQVAWVGYAHTYYREEFRSNKNVMTFSPRQWLDDKSRKDFSVAVFIDYSQFCNDWKSEFLYEIFPNTVWIESSFYADVPHIEPFLPPGIKQFRYNTWDMNPVISQKDCMIPRRYNDFTVPLKSVPA